MHKHSEEIAPGLRKRVKMDPLTITEKGSDDFLLRSAKQALEWNHKVPEGISVSFKDGWATLRGEVGLEFEKVEARFSIGRLPGVKGVIDEIVINGPSFSNSRNSHMDFEKGAVFEYRTSFNYGDR